jgi:hypothetical protein
MQRLDRTAAEPKESPRWGEGEFLSSDRLWFKDFE